MSADEESSPTVAGRAGRREWIGLAVIALPCLLYSMDLTVLNLALPQLSRDLAPSSSQLLWIVDIYGFLLAGSLITMGSLGDRVGRRRFAAYRGRRLRCRVGPGCVLIQRRDADRHARPLGHRGGDPRSFDSVVDPQHVPRPASEHGRRRCMGCQLLGRRRHRSASRRTAARAFLVGFGVPHRGPRDGAAAGAGSILVARVPGPQREQAGPDERSDVAYVGARADLRAQAGRRGRHGNNGGTVDHCRGDLRRNVPAAAANVAGPADRPPPVPGPRLQRVAADDRARPFRRVRCVPLHGSVPAAGARADPDGGRACGRCPRPSGSSRGRCWLLYWCAGFTHP